MKTFSNPSNNVSNPMLFINHAIIEKQNRAKMHMGDEEDYYDYDAGMYYDYTDHHEHIDSWAGNSIVYQNYNNNHRL